MKGGRWVHLMRQLTGFCAAHALSELRGKIFRRKNHRHKNQNGQLCALCTKCMNKPTVLTAKFCCISLGFQSVAANIATANLAHSFSLSPSLLFRLWNSKCVTLLFIVTISFGQWNNWSATYLFTVTISIGQWNSKSVTFLFTVTISIAQWNSKSVTFLLHSFSLSQWISFGQWNSKSAIKQQLCCLFHGV